MTSKISEAHAGNKEVAEAFVLQARELLKDEYLPKIERCLERLTDQQAWWRPAPESNSIGNLVLHLAGNASQWIVCGLGGQLDQRERDAEFAERNVIPIEQLLSRLQATIAEVDKVLAEFDTDRLLANFRIQGSDVNALTAIFHVTEHFSMHTGQIILLTKMLADVDMNFYDFSTGKPVHTWQK